MSKKQKLIRSFTRGDFRMAISMVRQNRARSLVTVVGIVIGVASVILIIGIGEGVKDQVQGQANRLGRDLLLIRPTSDNGVTGVGSLSSLNAISGLDDRDYQAVQKTAGIEEVVPLSTVEGTVITDENDRSFDGAVVATSPGFLDFLNQKVKYGGFLDDSQGADERAVIGANVATTVFKESVPLGRSFTFRDKTFVVSGVVDKFSTNPLLGDANFNNAIFIKYNVAQELTDNHVAIYELIAQVKDADNIDATVNAVTRNVRQVHGGANTVEVLKQGQSISATENILSLLTKFTLGAAAIALLIGGVGVMNIMLVSVTERMHEIGIRKAVGATNRQILAQFLSESVVLSVLGGAIGYAVGGAGIFLLSVYSDFQPTMPWVSGLFTVLLAIVVGALFGSFPAIKAARKDPIEALRSQ